MKTVTFVLWLFLWLTSLGLYCQTQSLYQFPSSLPEKYKGNVQEEYQKLAKTKVKGATSVDVSNYSELVSYGKAHLFESGQVYLGWDEMEEYLNKVLNKILPDSLKNKHCKLYLVRSPHYNAFALHDGAMFVNIGLLADVYNEAALAIIIGHEISHYLKDDVKDLYFQNLKAYSKKNRNKTELKFENAHTSQIQEHIADSIGFVLSQNAGYDLRFGLNNFYNFLISDLIEADKKSDLVIKTVGSTTESSKEAKEILLSSHPQAQERIDFLKTLLNDTTNTKSSEEFIIDKTQFNQLQEKAKYEVLSLLLNNDNYLTCITRAFEYYLQEPGNNTYIYYLVEAIRRKLYLDESSLNQGFLTDDFRFNFKKGKGILTNISFLVRDSLKYNNIKTTELLDTSKIAFNTYGEAFEYFKKIAIERKIKESFLSIAMNEKNDTVRKEFLATYLSYKDIKHPVFAKALNNNHIFSAIIENEEQSFFVQEIHFIEDHFYGYHLSLKDKQERSKVYYDDLEKMLSKKYPNKKSVFSKTLQSQNFNSYINSLDVINSINFFYDNYQAKTVKSKVEVEYFNDDSYSESVTFSSEETEPINPYMLDPSIWEYYMENNISSFEFVEIVSFDDQTAFVETIGNTILGVILIPFGVLYVGGAPGSNRFAYNLSYYRYNANEKSPLALKKTVRYKMKKAYLNNTIYHLLGTENEKD